MMWCSSCGGEGVLSSLSKKQKRARRLEREAAARVSTRNTREHLMPKLSTNTAPAKNIPCKYCQGAGLVPTPSGKPLPPYPESPRVAIVGAGIGGAALALALQQRGVHASLFERAVCPFRGRIEWGALEAKSQIHGQRPNTPKSGPINYHPISSPSLAD